MTDIQNWRGLIEVHPAADLFPMMSPAELDDLAADIKANGLRQPIVLFDEGKKRWLLDGRNRLDALSRIEAVAPFIKDFLLVGTTRPIPEWGRSVGAHRYIDKDPCAYVISANIHRRHLTTEQRKELAAKILALTPQKSDREIAKQVKVDHKTVAKVRVEKEASGEIPHSEIRGRQRAPDPATQRPAAGKVTPTVDPAADAKPAQPEPTDGKWATLDDIKHSIERHLVPEEWSPLLAWLEGMILALPTVKSAEPVTTAEPSLADLIELPPTPAAAPPVQVIEPSAPEQPQPANATRAPSVAPNDDDHAVKLYATWEQFKPNTQRRIVSWIEAGRPSGYGPIINDVIINEKTSALRDQLNAADDAVIGRFLAMTKLAAAA